MQHYILTCHLWLVADLLDLSVGVGAFVTGLRQISSFFLSLIQ